MSGGCLGHEPCGTHLGRSTSPYVELPSGLDFDSGPKSTATLASRSLVRIPWWDFEGTPLGRFEGNGGWGTSRTRPGVTKPVPHRKFSGIGRPAGTLTWQEGTCPTFAGAGARANGPYSGSSGISVGPGPTLERLDSSLEDRFTSKWTWSDSGGPASWRLCPGTRDGPLGSCPRPKAEARHAGGARPRDADWALGRRVRYLIRVVCILSDTADTAGPERHTWSYHQVGTAPDHVLLARPSMDGA